MLKVLITVLAFISVLLLAILFNTTTPAGVGPFGVLVVLFLIYLISLSFLTYFIYFTNRLIIKLSVIVATHRPLEPISFKRSYLFSTIIAVAPVMFIGLQSVGAMGVYGLFLILIFVSVGCLYISKKIN